MADCSELSKTMTEIATLVAARDGVNNLDDVVLAMKEYFPDITREYLSDAITEATTRQNKDADDLIKKLRAIRQEARGDKSLRDKIQELETYLEEGSLPEKKDAEKTMIIAIQKLRNTRNNLRKWLETGDPAMRKKLTDELDELNKKLESGDIEKTGRKGKLHDEIQKIKDEIDALKKQAIEDRKIGDLEEKIKTLQRHLEEETLPKVKPRKKGIGATEELKSILFDLRKELNQSTPARKKRLEKSISDLEQRLKTGNILPKARTEPTTNTEIENIIFKRDLLRREIQSEIRNLKPLGLWGKIGVGIDTIRLVMTTGEFSFALRQGGIYAYTHPLKWSKALVSSFKAFGSTRALYDLNKKIYSRENGPKYDKSGLVLLHEGMSLTRSEEVIMNYWMDKLPVFRNFNRAAIAFFNLARADAFDMGYKTLGKTGEMTQSEMEIWANYINVMTGRGKLGIGNVSLEPAALAFNRMFFSARYVASRFQFLLGQPLFHKAGSGSLRVRGMIAREYMRLGLGLFTVYSLGLLVGADVEPDPRSSDVGKLKFGNRRPDPLMGLGQVITFLSRLTTGTTKTGRGEVVPIRPKNVFFLDDKFYTQDAELKYGNQKVEDIFGRFLRSKLSPQFGFTMNILTGETYTGEKITLLNTVSQLSYPMSYGDIYEVMQEDGIPVNTALSILTFLGWGLQTYDVNEDKESLDLSQGAY